MIFNNQSKSFTSIDGHPIKVHLVSTGAVAVKTKFREARRKGLLAMIDFILDKTFTEWMPIWVMIIEHPEGIFVIDTGENSNVSDRGYFRSSGWFANWFNTSQFKFNVDREEEIDKQLESLKIPKEKIKTVVLTHLHLDHIDGLKYFPQTPIMVNKSEWEKPFGDLPRLYPQWFKPVLIDLDDKYDAFEHAYFLTISKDLILVRTPGHTWHHCSVILKTADAYIFFGADICYLQQQLIDEKYSGANASHRLSKDTYSKVKLFCENKKVVFIPSHEAAAAERLKNLQYLD